MTAKLPPHNSVVATAAALRSGAVRAREVAEAALARAEVLEPQVRSLVWRDDAGFLAAADAVDADRAAGRPVGPFAGVPMTVKDTFSVAGQPRTQGSLAVDDSPVDRTDLLPAAALRAGLVQLGRSAVPELAMTTSCESPRHGTTHNPWDLTRSPGGSSGGSAAAVAAGLVPVALAGDGGGSLRVPASFCGLVGLKPGRGLLPQDVQGWEGGATEGVLTRDVTGTAAVLQVLAAPDRLGWSRAREHAPDYLTGLDHAPAPLRVGVLTDAFDPAIEVDPACADAVRETAELLAAEGHRLVPLSPPPDARVLMDLYPRSVIPAWLQQVPLAQPELLQAYVGRVRALADGVGAADYVRDALALRRHARATAEDLLGHVDVVVTPTTATRVPAVGVVLAELRERSPSRDCTVYERTLAFTTVPSVLGVPAVSLPTSTDADGLPVGVQLVAPQGGEHLLLRLGRLLERRLRWHERLAPHAVAA